MTEKHNIYNYIALIQNKAVNTVYLSILHHYYLIIIIIIIIGYYCGVA